MASLKELRLRIKSVKSTQKITKAMQLVAAAKLRRAREAAEAARPYSDRMARVMRNLSAGLTVTSGPKLLSGTGKDDTYLLLVATSDRGLCGAFNGSLIRETRRLARQWKAEGKQVKLVLLGKKSYDVFRRDPELSSSILFHREGISRKPPTYENARDISQELVQAFEAGAFDRAYLLYNHFVSVISQRVTQQQIIPLARGEGEPANDDQVSDNAPHAVYEYEPSEEALIAALLPKNLEVQIFRAMLESNASEQGARMSAMDNATRNAGDMIKKINLKYNRSRQAAITKELTEIISGAEAI